MHRGISALHADCEQLGDLFRKRQKARHRNKWTPEVIGVEPRDDHALAHVRKVRCYIHQRLTQNWPSSIPITSVRGSTRSRISAAVETLFERMPSPECETMSVFE